MNRRFFAYALISTLSAAMLFAAPVARAADEAPDALIKRVSTEVLDAVKSDASVKAGDLTKAIALVDSQVMPHVNFVRMTAAAVGRSWREATPEQKKRLQDEFKTLLIRTYSGALSQVNDQTFSVKPLRAAAGDTEVIVRTEVLGKGEPVQLDYRMEKTPTGWKIYDLNVLGVWLVETYRTQFAQELSANSSQGSAKAIDGLIAALAQRNQSNAGGKKS